MFVIRTTSFATVPIGLMDSATNPRYNFSDFQTRGVENTTTRFRHTDLPFMTVPSSVQNNYKLRNDM
jgi:hypothetical protein